MTIPNSRRSKTDSFDLRVTGLGYLDRIHEKRDRHGAPFLAVDLTALRGTADRVEYTRFDCRVIDHGVQWIIRDLKPHLQAEKKVLIGFTLGDLHAETFVHASGPKAGQTGVGLKARLLGIDWIKVEGHERSPNPPVGAAPARAA
jgi:hypothetical protein